VGIRDRVVIEEYGIDFTTQPVNKPHRGQRDRIIFTPGTSAIRDVTSYGLGFTLITGVEESYDINSQDPRFTDTTVTPPVPFLPTDYTVEPTPLPTNLRNMTDHNHRHPRRGGRRIAYRLRGQRRRRVPEPDQFPRRGHGRFFRDADAGLAAGLDPGADQRSRGLLGEHPHPDLGG